MKFVSALFLAAFCACVFADDKYTDKYDDIDIDGIIGNKRLLTNYVKCLLDENPCTKEGEELKSVLGEALSNDCAKCNDKQRASAEKVIKHLDANEPELFKQLEAKYDPSGEYRKKYGGKQ